MTEAVDSSHGEPDKVREDELNQSKGDSDEMSGSQSDGDDNGQRHGSDDDHKQRKGRRPRRLKGGKRHRKHRPYFRKSYAEREKKTDSQSALNREDLFASGHPLAPFNTTQFLIDDHVKLSPDLRSLRSPARRDGSAEASDGQPTAKRPDSSGDAGFGDSAMGGSGLMGRSDMSQYDQEFVADYDSIREERLYSMSKEDLIRMTSRLMQRVGAGFDSYGDGVKHSKSDSRPPADRDSPSATQLSSCN